MQAGAKHVYGIERSAIAEQAQQIVLDNGYQDKVTIIRGKVEEVDLPVQQVTAVILPDMILPLCTSSLKCGPLHARMYYVCAFTIDAVLLQLPFDCTPVIF